MLSPLSGNEPRTRPVPASRSENVSFAEQRRANDLKHREEAVADERARLAQERREFERARSAWQEQREEERDQQITERHNAVATERAEAMAGDLGHDMDANRPGYVASLIINAARKAKGEFAEEPIGLAAEIVRMGKVRRGEAVSDDPPLPENPVAKALVLVGRRRRGETLVKSDEAFLNAYLEKVENGRRYR